MLGDVQGGQECYNVRQIEKNITVFVIANVIAVMLIVDVDVDADS